MPDYAIHYRLNRSLFEYTNAVVKRDDPDFEAMDQRNRYLATVFALLQQKQLHITQHQAASWLTDMYAELLSRLKRDGTVSIIDIEPKQEPTPDEPKRRRWFWSR